MNTKATQVNEGLSVQGLAHRVSDFVLRADLEIPRGERAVIMGASGSGKTTFLRVLAGLEGVEGPGLGRISLGGHDITFLPPQDRKMGFVFQDSALFPSMSVIENASFGLRMKGVPAAARRKEAMLWLEKVGLSSRADDSIERLSGGEKSRIAFVRALIWRPQCLLLDEPFAALDRSLRQTLRQELLRLHQQWPVPMILVTHDEEDAQDLATRRFEIREVAPGERRVVSV